MIEIGHRFALRWKHPHRTEATIVEVGDREIVADVVHRCGPSCYLKAMEATLPIDGRLTYRTDDFESMFVPMARDALALPA